MEVKEYLKQTDGIKHHIDLLRIESQQLKLQSQSVQGVQYGEHISSPNKNTEAPFVRCLLRKQEVDDQIKREEDYLSTLKMEISTAIDELPCIDERKTPFSFYRQRPRGQTQRRPCLDDTQARTMLLLKQNLTRGKVNYFDQ